MKRFAHALFPFLVVMTGPTQAADTGSAVPVVIELFTSQGCSSCPPADALLHDLSQRPDVVALSFHVDYWNRLGWKDPFSTPWTTGRQYAYRGSLGLPYVYTPQMVIDGTAQVVGTDRGAVEEAVARSLKAPNRVAVGLEPAGAGRVRLTLPAVKGMTGHLTLFGYDAVHKTDVKAGENSGRRITNAHVVRDMADWGRWSGEAVERTVDLPASPPGRGYAVLVVAEDGQPGRRILGAAQLPPPESH